MFRLVALISILTYPFLAHGVENRIEPQKVVDGQPATVDYVWWVSPGCSASAIAPHWFITAAHCGYDEAGNELTPGQMVFRKYPRAEESLVASEIIIHPEFTTDKSVYDPLGLGNLPPWDVMLVRVEQEIGLSSYPAISPPSSSATPAWWPNQVYGRNPRVAGDNYSCRRRQLELPVWPRRPEGGEGARRATVAAPAW